jgi:hypothetical protein
VIEHRRVHPFPESIAANTTALGGVCSDVRNKRCTSFNDSARIAGGTSAGISAIIDVLFFAATLTVVSLADVEPASAILICCINS